LSVGRRFEKIRDLALQERAPAQAQDRAQVGEAAGGDVGQRGGEVRGNLRAKTGSDVSAVARVFGGGGHRAAAGFTVGNATVEEVLRRVLPLLPGGHAE